MVAVDESRAPLHNTTCHDGAHGVARHKQCFRHPDTLATRTTIHTAQLCAVLVGKTRGRTWDWMVSVGWGRFISYANTDSGSRTSRMPVDTGIVRKPS